MKNNLFFFLLFLHGMANGQESLSSNEAHFYADAATNFLTINDKNIITGSEAVIMFLETDSSGRVLKINLMANRRGKHSLFSVLRKMKPEHFNEQQINQKAGGKIVIVPVFSLRYTPDSSNYMDKMRMPFTPFNDDGGSEIVKAARGYIMVDALSHVVGKPNRR